MRGFEGCDIEKDRAGIQWENALFGVWVLFKTGCMLVGVAGCRDVLVLAFAHRY